METHPIKDQTLVDRLTEAVESNLQNEHFGVPEISRAVGLSKSQLNRKLHELTGQSPSQFIREYRLKKALDLLRNHSVTASEVAYLVGFSSPSYFSTSFKEYFGYPPSEVKYQQEHSEKQNAKSTWMNVLMTLFPIVLIGVFAYFSFRAINEFNNKADQIILEKSIAILPFKNLSSNEDDQLLADAVMEQIHRNLQRIPDLHLRPTRSSEQFRNSSQSIKDIGQELQVNYILTGNFQKIDNQANISVKLINVSTDQVIWGEEYNRDWTDVFKVQSEVAVKTAESLSTTLGHETQKAINSDPTSSMQALEYFLKGSREYWDYWEKHDTTLLNTSRLSYLKAIELDPNYSYPYTGLAKINIVLAAIRDKSNRERLMAEAGSNLKKAVTLDPYNGWAYAELGSLQWHWYSDTVAARKSFEIAKRLEPNNPNVYDNYYQMERRLGNCEKMERLLQGISMIDPDAEKDDLCTLIILNCEKNFAEIAKRADLYWNDSCDVIATREFFYGYLYTKQYKKAGKLANYIRQKNHSRRLPYELLGLLSAAEGDRVTANAYIDSLIQLSAREYISKVAIAGIHATLGNKEEMYHNLDLAQLNAEPPIHGIAVKEQFSPYRNEPRFQEIWAKAWIPRSQEELTP